MKNIITDFDEKMILSLTDFLVGSTENPPYIPTFRMGTIFYTRNQKQADRNLDYDLKYKLWLTLHNKLYIPLLTKLFSPLNIILKNGLTQK